MDDSLIRYTVTLHSPEAHIYQVEIHIQHQGTQAVKVYLPAWIRGSYMIRDFSKHVISFSASVDGKTVNFNKTDKQSWEIATRGREYHITYSVYAWDLSVRSAHFDTTHAYFNGSCLLMGVMGREAEAVELSIVRNTESRYANWKVATSLAPVKIDNQGFGSYQAPDYEVLTDSPVEIGEWESREIAVAGKPHFLIVTGRHNYGDLERLCEDLQNVCEQHVSLFGELPLEHYHFLLQLVGDGYGGLEHADSTSLIASRFDLPHVGLEKMTTGYRRLLGLCSHEYFHLWNVKRIKPAVFQVSSTTSEVYTRQLWLFEGITSYYDDLALVRSGVFDISTYFELLAETITRVMRVPGRKKQTLEESSFDAWTKFYQQNENAPNAIISYYTKGALFALALDIKIRLETDGRFSLDDLMRQLWVTYGRQGSGLPENAFEGLAEQVTSLDLKEFFEQGLRTTEDLPLKDLLQNFGVSMFLDPAQSGSDKGQFCRQQPEKKDRRPVLGAQLATASNEIKIAQVFEGQAAQLGGLSAGDTIVAVDGLRLNEQQIECYLATRQTGEAVHIHVFRRDELMEFDLYPQFAPEDTCTLYLPEKIPNEQQARLNAWLGTHG